MAVSSAGSRAERASPGLFLALRPPALGKGVAVRRAYRRSRTIASASSALMLPSAGGPAP